MKEPGAKNYSCPIHDIPMYHHVPSNTFACQNSKCKYGRGVQEWEILPVPKEKWKKVMDSTNGHKVGRAIYEAGQKLRPLNKKGKVWDDWDKLEESERQFFFDLAGDLFDNGVIEGGNNLANLYVETRDRNTKS